MFYINEWVEPGWLLSDGSAISRRVLRVLGRSERQTVLVTNISPQMILFVVGIGRRDPQFTAVVGEDALRHLWEGDVGGRLLRLIHHVVQIRVVESFIVIRMTLW